MKRIGIIIFYVILCFSFTKIHASGWEVKPVYISGKLINYTGEENTISFIFRDLLSLNEKQVAEIKEDASFELSIPLAYPQDFYLNYGTLATLFCVPGDTLNLQIDADILKDKASKSPNGNYFVSVESGTSKQTNDLIFDYLEKMPAEDKDPGIAVKSKSAMEYFHYIKDQEQQYKAYYQKFVSENSTTEMFDKWALDRLKYKSYDDLLRYTWYHPYSNGIEFRETKFEIPKEYFSFLEDYDMNDCEVVSMSHADFLKGYSMYVQYYVDDTSFEKLKTGREEGGFIQLLHVLKDLIKNNTNGFTRDVLFAQTFVGFLQSHLLVEFEQLYEPDLIASNYFQEIINVEHNKSKEYLQNSNAETANISDLHSQSDVFLEITSKYKDKVIYIDFWAPWCAPCLKEFEFSKELQKQYEGQDIVFLFLGIQCSKDSWKTTIANKQLKGEHILLTNDQFNILSGEFSFSSIPHYILVGKRGNVIFKNAPAPSNKELIIKHINKALRSNENMVSVQGGTYTTKRRQADDTRKWEEVNLTVDDFLIDPYEVTVQQFSDFVEATSYITVAEIEGGSTIIGGNKKAGVNWRHDAIGNLRPIEDYIHPVIHLTPKDAQAYAEWCGKRLPTEAEWEYAARGGALSKNYKYSGSNRLKDVAWTVGKNNNTSPTGLLNPNELGLYDMTGNVWEICSDSYMIRETKVSVRKGGDFIHDEKWLQNYNSWITEYDEQPIYWNGFRCVKSVESK